MSAPTGLPPITSARETLEDAVLAWDEGRVPSLKAITGLIAHAARIRAARAGSVTAEPQHRCGVRGFDGMKDVCPACAARSGDGGGEGE